MTRQNIPGTWPLIFRSILIHFITKKCLLNDNYVVAYDRIKQSKSQTDFFSHLNYLDCHCRNVFTRTELVDFFKQGLHDAPNSNWKTIFVKFYLWFVPISTGSNCARWPMLQRHVHAKILSIPPQRFRSLYNEHRPFITSRTTFPCLSSWPLIRPSCLLRCHRRRKV